MEPFTRLTAVAAPLDAPNIDTDQILPARFLRRPRSGGYADYLFHDLRFEGDGSERPDFILNQPDYREARILVADRNFGGGSSREQAVWGLVDYGIRCVIAPSFGDIFFNNAPKNGLLPVRQDATLAAHLRTQLHERPGAQVAVDLEAQIVTAPDGTEHQFEIDPFRKRCLLLGLDDVALTLELNAEIADFEKAYRERRHWLFGGQQSAASSPGQLNRS